MSFVAEGSTRVALISGHLLERGEDHNILDKPIPSTTPCWTCRRSRVVCDKASPTCAKCRQLGRPCLGYKKPLVWNKGVASRGKLMGKSFNDLDPQNMTVSSAAPESPISQLLEVCISSTLGSQKLADPIFQGFDTNTRYYLDYCKLICCIPVVF